MTTAARPRGREAAKLRRELSAACAESRKVTTVASRCEKRKKELGALIGRLAELLGIATLAGDGWLLCRGKSSRSEISAERLRELGVADDLIAAATVRKEYEYWQVLGQPGKEKGDG